jgi:hypothetical protein
LGGGASVVRGALMPLAHGGSRAQHAGAHGGGVTDVVCARCCWHRTRPLHLPACSARSARLLPASARLQALALASCNCGGS